MLLLPSFVLALSVTCVLSLFFLKCHKYNTPEPHGAPTKTDLPYNFCFITFMPSCTVEAVDAPQTLFRASLTLGVGVQGQNLAKNLPFINIYSYAKFHQVWPDGLDFYNK